MPATHRVLSTICESIPDGQWSQNARAFVAEADKAWLLYRGEQHENIDGMRDLWEILEEAGRGAEDV